MDPTDPGGLPGRRPRLPGTKPLKTGPIARMISEDGPEECNWK